MSFRPLTCFEFFFHLHMVVEGPRPHQFKLGASLIWNHVTEEVTVCSYGVACSSKTIMVSADLDFWGVQDSLETNADCLEVLGDLVHSS